MPTSKKERWTVTFRVDSEPIKNEINKFYTNLADQYPDKFTGKGQALYYHMKQGQELIEKLGNRPPSKTEQEVLEEVNCYYLKGETQNWECFENYWKTKKAKKLPEDPIQGCNLCQLGKSDQVKQEVEKQLRKKNIKDIIKLRELFIEMMDKGGPIKLWICKADLLLKHEIQLCSDMENLKCPFNEYNEVSVQHFCSTQINPETNEIPCPHLKLRIITGRIETQQTKDLIEQIYLEHQATDQHPRKVVDIEQEEPEKEEE